MDLDSDTVDSRPDADAGPEDATPTPARLARTTLDAATWGVVVALLGAALLGVVGLVVGNGLVGFKRGLFVFGFLAMGGSLLALRPRRPWTRDAGDDGGTEHGESAGGEADAERSEPAADAAGGPPTLLPDSLAPDPAHRASWGLRLFFGGIWALVGSYVLETVFGVVPV
jgi:hypothetical protein